MQVQQLLDCVKLSISFLLRIIRKQLLWLDISQSQNVVSGEIFRLPNLSCDHVSGWSDTSGLTVRAWEKLLRVCWVLRTLGQVKVNIRSWEDAGKKFEMVAGSFSIFSVYQ